MVVYKFAPLAPGAPVRITDSEGTNVNEGTTDRSGVYTVELDAGTYTATTDPDRVVGHTTANALAIASDGDVLTYDEQAAGYVPEVGGGSTLSPRKFLQIDFDYTVDVDTTDETDGTVVTTTPLVEGTIIERAWVGLIGNEFFTADDAQMEMYVALRNSDGSGFVPYFLWYDLAAQQQHPFPPARGVPIGVPPAADTDYVPCVVTGSDAHILIHLVTGGAFTAGSASLFVLYSEPA